MYYEFYKIANFCNILKKITKKDSDNSEYYYFKTIFSFFKNFQKIFFRAKKLNKNQIVNNFFLIF